MAYVFYVKVNNETVPIKCQGYLDDGFIPDYARLFGVEGISEGLYPDLEVETLIVKKENIDYYLIAKGPEKDEKSSDEDNSEKQDQSIKDEKQLKPEQSSTKRRRSRFSS